MKTQSLNGKWTLNFQEKSYDAIVPGLDLIDLINAGVVGEPNDSKTDDEYFFISKEDKTYICTFEVTKKDLEAEEIELFFERLDTLAEVSLNGELIGEAANIHIPHSFNVKEHLRIGENELSVKFKALRNYIDEKQKELKLPFNAMGTNGHPHIRKCACHFGWDFAPELGVQGISGNCELRFVNNPQIAFVKLTETVKKNIGYLNGRIDFTKEVKKGEVEVIFTHPSGLKESLIVDATETPYFSFSVKDPELWWCNGLGAQPLYKVEVFYKIKGKVISSSTKKIGFRTIKLDTAKDAFGSNFQFEINGLKIFSKGANYIPMDALYTRITRERLYELLWECKNANYNMIRVWGGGFYESEDFYDICDELGILIWQDFGFACCAYPFNRKGYLKNVKKEIEFNVKRLMHRASLALWCGNNEIESISMGWILRKDLIDSTGKFFYETLPSEIRKYDSVTPYHACSPSSGKYMRDMNSDKYGDTHIWNVWHGYQFKEYFRKRLTRFASEFGMQSYPNIGVIPHQKCDLGEERLNYYLSALYTMPRDEREKIYLTQLIQAEAMKEAAEHFRRNSFRCHGSLYWQLNDIWSSASWAALDCEIGRKALMYKSKHFYSPILISAAPYRNHIQIHVSSDLKEHFEGSAVISKVNTLSGEEAEIGRLKVFLTPFLSKCIHSIKKAEINSKEEVLVLRLFDNSGNLMSENRAVFTKDYNLKLKRAKIRINGRKENGKRYLDITADAYARYVYINARKLKLSDNFFDLSEGETKSVLIESEGEIEFEITATSLYDVLLNKNKKYDRKIKAEEALKPMAVINRVSRYFEK